MGAFHKTSVEVSVETSNAILSGPQPCEYIFHNICEVGLYPNEISFVRNASGGKSTPSPSTFPRFTLLLTKPPPSPPYQESLDILYLYI